MRNHLVGPMLITWGLAIAATPSLSCRSEKAPSISRSPSVTTQNPDQGGPPPAPNPQHDAPSPPAEGEGQEEGGGGTPEGTGKVPVLDKDRLWSCYQQVYCAQKKGEMDRILDIYRQCGFQNPQDFTTAWIEAAKDTEWVSRLAHEVSKACK